MNYSNEYPCLDFLDCCVSNDSLFGLPTKVESSKFYAFSHWIIQTSIIFFIVWLIVFKTIYSPVFLIMSKVQRLRTSPMNSSTECPYLYCLDRYVSNDSFYGLPNIVGSSEFDSFTIESFGRVSGSLLFAFQTIRTPTILILPEVERLTPRPWINRTSILFFIFSFSVFKTLHYPVLLVLSEVQRLKPSSMNYSNEYPCLYSLNHCISNVSFSGLFNIVLSSPYSGIRSYPYSICLLHFLFILNHFMKIRRKEHSFMHSQKYFFFHPRERLIYAMSCNILKTNNYKAL